MKKINLLFLFFYTSLSFLNACSGEKSSTDPQGDCTNYSMKEVSELKSKLSDTRVCVSTQSRVEFIIDDKCPSGAYYAIDVENPKISYYLNLKEYGDLDTTDFPARINSSVKSSIQADFYPGDPGCEQIALCHCQPALFLKEISQNE